MIHDMSDTDIDLYTFLDLIEADEQQKTVATSRAQRMADWVGRQDELPAEKLMELHQMMSEFIAHKFAKVYEDKPVILTDDQLNSLMDEILDIDYITEALDSRRITIRRMILDHVTSSLAAQGHPDPAHTNAEVVVPAFGKKFCREGNGHTKPSVDEDALAREFPVSDEVKFISSNEVFDIVEVPATFTRVLNEDKLMNVIKRYPEVLEIVRRAVVPGEPKTPRFQIRPL